MDKLKEQSDDFWSEFGFNKSASAIYGNIAF